jgi:hypothetical protein
LQAWSSSALRWHLSSGELTVPAGLSYSRLLWALHAIFYSLCVSFFTATRLSWMQFHRSF